MTAGSRFPREIRWTVVLGLLGLALAVPFSAPDGTGMQWDELVLAMVAAHSGWTVFRLRRSMDKHAARPWLAVGMGGLFFMTAQLLAGLFPGPAFDGFGIDDVVLFAGATSPLVTCAILARQVIRTRWTTLVVDGAIVTVALFVVSDVLLAHPVHEAAAPGDLHVLVLAYGGYAAVVLGSAGALCTVSTAALRRSASTMIWANVWMAAGALCEAMAIVAPSPLWTAASDATVVLGLEAVLLATSRAPQRFERSDARSAAPKVGTGGMVIVLTAMFGLPLAMVVTAWRGHELHVDGIVGCAVVFTLSAVRVVLRMREDGRVTEDLVRSEEDFRGLVESSSDGVAIVDGDLRLMFASPAARSLLGIAGARSDELFLPDLVAPEDRALVQAAADSDGTPVLHFRVLRPDGSAGELEATSTERPGSDRRVFYLRDVTVRRRRERELERMAYTDHLSGLPNRAMLYQEMADLSAVPGEHSLLVLDLDGFKTVNDVAGHEAGDQLLVEVARRLNTVVREDDVVARLGGDEFAILVSGTLEEAAEVAQRVVDALAVPHTAGGWNFAVGGSVGVAAMRAGSGQVAFREADAALRAAKQAGKGCVRVAGDDLAFALASGSDLAAALAEGAVRLRLDPTCDPDGRVVLVHAHPVWEHAVHGTVQGQDLWGAAERQGSSAALQRWLLREACATIARTGDEHIAVAVSLPAGHVSPDGLATETLTALAAASLPASRLVLSLTEETLLTSTAALVPELEAARRAGVQLCLDNYGMGHSLFALLARISLDIVRVDLAALATRDDTDRALQVLAAIVRTTSSFGLTAIAGGIGTPELRDAALDTGVRLLHGRALPHDLDLPSLRALVTATAAPAAAALAD